MSVPIKLYTAEDFLALVADLPDNQQYELIDGELITMPPSSNQNSLIAFRIGRYIGNFVEEYDLGHVMGADGGYPMDDGTYLVPDVSFVSKVNSPELPPKGYSPPDLVVEVISPSETPRMVTRKTERYLQAGTSLVWNVHPEDKVIEVWSKAPDGGIRFQSFSAEDTLTGGTVLPNFELLVGKVFQGV